ncbi:hypothetical protein PBY51_001277 [Eleginops maclovinus]|uniref:Uncharacterized protein n=1 Tax=Eleginops maclovinus TaxID=56733 RepID=A0AAN8A5E3_ELEMC|nr:hypothetical protein PBY51_001277 [Eleginops maclovinus]
MFYTLAGGGSWADVPGREEEEEEEEEQEEEEEEGEEERIFLQKKKDSKEIWLKMSVDSDNSCVLLSSRGSRTSCVFQNEDEKDDIPGAGEESVLEMLSYSKFSDLETWLCMPSSLLLPRALDSTCSSSSSSNNSSSSHASHPSSQPPPPPPPPPPVAPPAAILERCRRGPPQRLTPPSSPLLWGRTCRSCPPPLLSSTPALQSRGDCPPHSGVSVRKRRRIAASPGGLHWTSAGSVQRDFWSPDPSHGRGARSAPPSSSSLWGGPQRKTVCEDERLQPHLRLLTHLERGRKLRGIQSPVSSGRYDCRKK